MKIAIVSDFHIGFERFFDDAFSQAWEALDSASKEADMLIIPGDVFDMRAPKPEVIALAMSLFRNIMEKKWQARITEYTGERKVYTDLPIIAIPGTHERRAQGAENAVELLSLAGFLVNVSEARAVVKLGDEKVAVCAIGGVDEEKVKETMKKVPGPLAGAFNIFMFHQSIYELLPFSEDFIRYDDLPEGYDLYVDGHIHNAVEDTVHGKPFLIPGSTVLTQLKEGEQSPKGFFIFDTQKKSYEFREIHSRKFIVEGINVDNKNPDDIRSEAESRIKEIISKHYPKPIIRIIFSGSTKDPLKRLNIEMHELIKKYANDAMIDVGKAETSPQEIYDKAEEMRNNMLENASIKDFGMALFLEKIAAKGYKLDVSPNELFDILVSESNKEKSIKKAMDALKINSYNKNY
jgi:DNA repair exonuclease SbcCD nuclease subunit